MRQRPRLQLWRRSLIQRRRSRKCPGHPTYLQCLLKCKQRLMCPRYHNHSSRVLRHQCFPTGALSPWLPQFHNPQGFRKQRQHSQHLSNSRFQQPLERSRSLPMLPHLYRQRRPSRSLHSTHSLHLCSKQCLSRLQPRSRSSSTRPRRSCRLRCPWLQFRLILELLQHLQLRRNCLQQPMRRSPRLCQRHPRRLHMRHRHGSSSLCQWRHTCHQRRCHPQRGQRHL